jgi:hypothetical protein
MIRNRWKDRGYHNVCASNKRFAGPQFGGPENFLAVLLITGNVSTMYRHSPVLY